MKSVKLLATALVLACALPLAAQDPNIKVSVFYSQTELQGENDFGGGVPSFSTEFDDGNGYGVAASMHYNSFFSVEAALFNTRNDTALVIDEAAAVNLGTLSLTPISLGAQLHILGDRRIDPYIGAGGAYVIGDDFLTPDTEAAGLGRIEVENAATYYINAGIAVQFTDGFGLVIDGRQYQYEPSSRSSVTGVEQDLEINPRILSAGFRLRF
jgi:outer membrane protein W